MQCPVWFLDKIRRYPSISKSNRLHVDIFWFSLLIWGTLHRFLKKKISTYIPEVLNFNWVFLKLNQLICILYLAANSPRSLFPWGPKSQLWASRTHWSIVFMGCWLCYANKWFGLALQVGSSFLLTFIKELPCKHPSHNWNLGRETCVKVVSPNFHALSDWDCMSDLKWTGTYDARPVWTGP